LISLQRVIETGESVKEIEYRVLHIDGTWRWYSASALPVKDICGKVILFEGIGRDITDKKLIEQALRKSKEMYDKLVSKIPVGIYILHTTADG
jgi:PAS domain-containing protein